MPTTIRDAYDINEDQRRNFISAFTSSGKDARAFVNTDRDRVIRYKLRRAPEIRGHFPLNSKSDGNSSPTDILVFRGLQRASEGLRECQGAFKGSGEPHMSVVYFM